MKAKLTIDQIYVLKYIMAMSGECKNSKEPKKTSNKPENNRKITHLYLNDKYLSTINNLNGYTNITVLYLHNNDIDRIQNLNNLFSLRNLYLQRNKIRKIENLETLIKLRRLYLGYNKISVVENLDNLKCLEELHIEKQNLPSGEKLCFDPRSIQCLAECLEILNISSNNISTIQMLGPLKYLRTLFATNNRISSLENTTATIKQLTCLKEAHFFGNPVSKEHRYRENVIAKSNNLKILDNKEITDITRSFMRRFEIEKNNFEKREYVKFPKNIAAVSKNYPIALQKAVSNFMLKPTKNTNSGILPSTIDTYIPWKCMPSSLSDMKKKIPPLLRKQKKRNECRIINLSNLPNLL